MIPRRYVIAGLGIGLAIVLAVILRPNRSDDGNRAAEPVANVSTGESAEPEAESEGEVEGEEGRGGAAEAQEEAEVTEKRLEALAEARANGDFGQKIAATTAPATGWVGSRVMSSNFDDWEPAVADRPEGAVHLLPHHALRRRGTAGCTARRPGSRSRSPRTAARPGAPRCRSASADRSKAQYDPTIEVVPNTGAVYSAFLNFDRHNGFSTVFTKSTDHGQTWTEPVHVYGNVSWTDKPEITRAPPGRTSTSHGTGRRAATFTSASPTTSARRGRSRSSPTTSATTTPTTPASSATGRSSSRNRASSTPVSET